MNFADIDNTYLTQAIERIKTALETVSKLPVMINPPDEQHERVADSIWYVGALLMTGAETSSDLSRQDWSVVSYLVWKKGQTDYDATIYSAMYALIPKVFNYMQAHKSLVFTDGQSALPYLENELVKVTLNALNQNGQPGFSIVHRLPFRISIDQEY